MLAATEVIRSRQWPTQTIMQNFPKFGYSLALVTCFYQQKTKSLLNIGKLQVKSEWPVASDVSPASDPSPEPSGGDGETPATSPGLGLKPQHRGLMGLEFLEVSRELIDPRT